MQPWVTNAAHFLFLMLMSAEKVSVIKVDHHIVSSVYLKREVKVDCYLPQEKRLLHEINLLLVNDGQDLVKMRFEDILEDLAVSGSIVPLFCVGIHCSEDRKNEYGTANTTDYKGRGAKAQLYTQFVFEELLPFIRTTYAHASFREKSFAGFSLGGLSALDIVWNHPHEFVRAGVFSGSLWWRNKDQDHEGFDENIHRIMHRQVKDGSYAPWLKFFFAVGTKDETADRNNNGIIDAIDDTLALIEELEQKGYNKEKDIFYLELANGRHDVPTWALAFPAFLMWGWGTGL